MSYNSKYTGAEVEALLDSANDKQDKIDDLDAIREKAEEGATVYRMVQDNKLVTPERMVGTIEDFIAQFENDVVEPIAIAVEDKVDSSSLATVATSGSYNDLSNKPTIPAEQVNADWNATSGKAQILNKPTIPTAVTESTVSGWGFTKNTGTYSKPSGGIPKTDLASAVQTSLGKADSALQAHQTLKTINGESLVGNGNISIEPDVSQGDFDSLADTVNNLDVDVAQLTQEMLNKQERLVSGTNLKTINGQSLLGSGNITIEGGGGGASSGGGMKIVNCGTGFIEIDAAEPNTIYVSTHNDTSGGLGIYGFIPPTEAYAEYIFIFQIGIVPSGLDVPEFVLWPNGVMPELPAPTAQQGTTKFELNISASLIEGGSYIYKAVLTHFKEIEW